MVKDKEPTVTSTLWVQQGVIREIELPVMIHLEYDRVIHGFLIRVDIDADGKVRVMIMIQIVHYERSDFEVEWLGRARGGLRDQEVRDIPKFVHINEHSLPPIDFVEADFLVPQAKLLSIEAYPYHIISSVSVKINDESPDDRFSTHVVQPKCGRSPSYVRYPC